MPPPKDGEVFSFSRDQEVQYQLELLSMEKDNLRRRGMNVEETRTAPLFSKEVAEISERELPGCGSPFKQYGLLAGRTRPSGAPEEEGTQEKEEQDPRIFLNVSAPWSAFICGSQGSGKSHSLACMLENCLASHKYLGSLPHPLTAVVFHYDPHASMAGQVCEAAYLCSPSVKVRVLAPPTSYKRLSELYGKLKLPKDCEVTVEKLILKQEYLNVERLKTFMATDSGEGLPLYMHAVLRVLREMALESDSKPGIDYLDFKRRVERLDLAMNQKTPLALRLDLLREFIEEGKSPMGRHIQKSAEEKKGNSWEPVPGRLTIIDLSCQFVDVSMACTIFEIYLGVFMEQKSDIGRLVALDEAHKFMGESSGAAKLTDALLSAIRLQRHSACRIIIATQEPTISPKLLDLCSFTLVHRFTSPDWFKTIKAHLGPAAVASAAADESSASGSMMSEIVDLNVGEALLFAPSAMLQVDRLTDEEKNGEGAVVSRRVKKLGMQYWSVRIRKRVTVDGGRSIMAG